MKISPNMVMHIYICLSNFPCTGEPTGSVLHISACHVVGATGTSSTTFQRSLEEATKGMVAEAQLHKMREMDPKNVTEGGSFPMVISPLSSNHSPSKPWTISSSSSSSSGGISDSGKISDILHTRKSSVWLGILI